MMNRDELSVTVREHAGIRTVDICFSPVAEEFELAVVDEDEDPEFL